MQECWSVGILWPRCICIWRRICIVHQTNRRICKTHKASPPFCLLAAQACCPAPAGKTFKFTQLATLPFHLCPERLIALDADSNWNKYKHIYGNNLCRVFLRVCPTVLILSFISLRVEKRVCANGGDIFPSLLSLPQETLVPA